MKKVIAIALSALVLVACLAVARWADGKNTVNKPTETTQTTAPGSVTTTPTMPTENQTTTQPTTPTNNPDDIENGLGWG